MRKFLSILLLASSLGLMCNAQQFSYGYKAGASFSGMNLKEGSTKTGFNGGIFGQLRIASFAIQPEMLYGMQGMKYKYDLVTEGDAIISDYSGKVSMAYLSIPLMLKYYVVSGLSIEAGPQLGFLLSAKDKPDDWEKRDVKDIMKKTDFAINFGASYKLPLAPVGFYARYSLGLTDIYNTSKSGSDDAGKNRVFQIGAFVIF